MNSSVLQTPEITALDEALGHPAVRPVVEIYKWATEQGLRGANAETVFDEYCRRLVVDGVRCCAAMSRRRPCIRNGAATATPGVARPTRSTCRCSCATALPPTSG